MKLETRTTDQRFSDRWLFEMPMRTGPTGYSPFDALNTAVDINIENGLTPKQHTIVNDIPLYSINDGVSSYYWLGSITERLIIANLTPFEMGMMVEDVGKNPYISSKIYASEFYNRIVTSGVKLLFSGDKISSEGERIWHHLLKNRATLLGYDPSDSRKFMPIRSKDDLEKFIGDLPEYTNLRFVLSENVKEAMIEWNQFEIYRIHRLVHKY